MKIVILDGAAANPGDIDWKAIEEFGEVIVYDVTPPELLIERAIDAEICITNKTAFTREVIENLPKLKYIGVLATGFNVIDLKAASDHGIVVTNVPEYSTYATMQHTIALILELTNHVGIHNKAVQDGRWITSTQFCFWDCQLMEICGKTVVIVGYGKIGQRVAATCKALGANIVVVPHRMPENPEAGITYMTYEDAIKIADIISFHCPLTPETTGIVNKDTIAAMKNGVLIVNAARGPIVNESDMREALTTNKVGGYAADVISVEPMLETNPLLGAPNCILTPHTAWAPKETRIRLVDAAADNIRAFLNGAPINKVN